MHFFKYNLTRKYINKYKSNINNKLFTSNLLNLKKLCESKCIHIKIITKNKLNNNIKNLQII